MSYDFRLCDPVSGKTLHTSHNHFICGGTYCIGGTSEMWLNITYNYSRNYRKAFKNSMGIQILAGKTGAESIPLLKNAISNLSDEVNEDYWTPTEGNAKRALYGLLAFAQMRPDGVWDYR